VFVPLDVARENHLRFGLPVQELIGAFAPLGFRAVWMLTEWAVNVRSVVLRSWENGFWVLKVVLGTGLFGKFVDQSGLLPRGIFLVTSGVRHR
jgi:hypothetical protein